MFVSRVVLTCVCTLLLHARAALALAYYSYAVPCARDNQISVGRVVSVACDGCAYVMRFEFNICSSFFTLLIHFPIYVCKLIFLGKTHGGSEF